MWCVAVQIIYYHSGQKGFYVFFSLEIRVCAYNRRLAVISSVCAANTLPNNMLFVCHQQLVLNYRTALKLTQTQRLHGVIHYSVCHSFLLCPSCHPICRVVFKGGCPPPPLGELLPPSTFVKLIIVYTFTPLHLKTQFAPPSHIFCMLH